MDFIKELKWRGMIQDIVPGTQEHFKKRITSAYIGFDPTSDSLHIGSLVQIMILKHLQNCGHKPIILVGGATGMVGDPSGKSKERNLLDEGTLDRNLKSIRKQLEKFLDFNCGANSAEIVNNFDWFKNYSFLEFIRDIGKHISINYMMSKDSVKSRLETGMSFTEFSYQLVQGYDFYRLWSDKKCLVQLGGSDQWGNIVTGIELIRRKGNSEAFAVTSPLLKKSDGGKFGKTEEGNVWLDKNKTTVYKFYQFWINCSDNDAKNYIKIFSTKTEKEISDIINEHNKNPHFRLLQKKLAEEVTTFVHSKEELNEAIKASNILFGKSTAKDLQEINETTFLNIFEGVQTTHIVNEDLNKNLLDFLVSQNIFKSNGEAKRMIQSNAVSINKEKINLSHSITSKDFIKKKYLLVQKGKKNYFIVVLN